MGTFLPNLFYSVTRFGRMVKFSHTIFALPFALASTALAAQGHGITFGQIIAIVLAMVGARTAAMGFNRIVDRHLDAKNPRTAQRELPTGQVSLGAATLLTLLSIGVFLAAAAWLGPLCLGLSPVVLVLILGYSYTKRFTWLCHLVLGLAIGIAPLAAWIAVRGEMAAPPVWLMMAVVTWIGGFDILYALADEAFDRGASLHSIPVRFGVTRALIISALLHLGTLVALVAVGLAAELGLIYFTGVILVGAIFIWEHSLVRPRDLSRLNLAFFNLNGYVATIYFVATLAEVFLG
jgi:4-hydroxybenzoate polyprenyltransferase